MSLDVRIVATGTDELPLIGYYAYIRQKSADVYLDFNDNTWKAFADLVTASIAYTEDANQPGWWLFSHAMPAFDGIVQVISRDTDAGLLVPGYEIQETTLEAGEPILDLARAQVMLHTDLGGLNAYRVTDNNGVPIEDAIIRVFTKTDYDAGDFDSPWAITNTNSDGRWLNPVPVNAGATYTLLINKPHVYGSVSVEITV